MLLMCTYVLNAQVINGNNNTVIIQQNGNGNSINNSTNTNTHLNNGNIINSANSKFFFARYIYFPKKSLITGNDYSNMHLYEFRNDGTFIREVIRNGKKKSKDEGTYIVDNKDKYNNYIKLHFVRSIRNGIVQQWCMGDYDIRIINGKVYEDNIIYYLQK